MNSSNNNSAINPILRQGDVALRKVMGEVPNFSNVSAKADKAVAYGEHSGHAHLALGADTHVFEFQGKMYVSVGSDGGTLSHIHVPTGRQADHNPLFLEANAVYEVIHQNNFNPFTKVMERVID